MGKTKTALTAALCAATFLHPSPTDACIHAAGEGGGPVEISQKGHQGLLVWHDGEQELVLKIEYESGADVGALGLVVPVPAAPESYDTADADLFDALHRWTRLERRRPALRGLGASRSRNGNHGASGPSLVALPAASAGPFRIQPLQAFGDEGVTALTTWMEDNGFAPIPREVLSYYTERAWTFLTVKIDPAEGEALGREGGLPPLRVRFESERAIYPLKLEAQGTFPLRLYLVTREPLSDDAFGGAVERGFEVAGAGSMRPLGAQGPPLGARVGRFSAASAPEELRAILDDFEGFDEGELTLRVLFSRRFGRGRADPSRWAEELSFPATDEGERLMGTARQPAAEPESEPEPEPEPANEPEPEPASASGAAASASESESETESGGCATSGAPTSLPLLAFLVGLALLRRRLR